MTDITRFANVFDSIEPWAGTPPKGFLVDSFGILTDATFRQYLGIDREKVGGTPVTTHHPVIEDGEGWFEAVNWFEAAREARGRFVMITLGACYGAQAVGSAVALRRINPMPFKLVAVEPEPDNVRWVAKHFADNGIDPDDQWLVPLAISDSNAPVFFPVGSPGSGAQNCYSTNEKAARQYYFDTIVENGRVVEALGQLLLENTTGLHKNLVNGENFDSEIKIVSAVTLPDVLGPFDFVDYLEADMQQSEAIVFPPYMGLLKKKVRRVHIGTHGRDVHADLAHRLREDGWRIVFDYAPETQHQCALGSFRTNDGVLTAVNDALERRV